MTARLAVAERSGNVVTVERATGHAAAARVRRAAIARLQTMLPRDAIIYAVRRAADAEFGWLVCDLYRIDGTDIACLTVDVGHALECHDPAREVGLKLRSGAASDPLTHAGESRLPRLTAPATWRRAPEPFWLDRKS